MPSVGNFYFEEVIEILKRFGFVLSNTKGSHRVFYNYSTEKMVSVPDHGRKNKIRPGTMSDIIKWSGIPRKEWFEMQSRLK